MPRLRVLAGPTPTSLTHISDVLNTNKQHTILSDHFAGQVVVNVKGFTDPYGRILDSEYFHRPDRKDITWSIQVQGRFLQPHSADEILFGNTFDRPLKLPWGSGAALKFMHFVDPTLEHDLSSPVKPWALSPLISTMPHFSHARPHGSRSSSRSSSHSRRHSQQVSAESSDREGPSHDYRHRHHLSVPSADHFQFPPFPPQNSMEDDLSHIHFVHWKNPDASPSTSGSELSSPSSSSSSLLEDAKSIANANLKKAVSKAILTKDAKLGITGPHSLNLHTAQQRRSYFHKAKHRKEVTFGPRDILTMDFCYGFLEFSPNLALRLPGGVSFDLMKYWDGQPIRFVCCERKKKPGDVTYVPGDDSEDPWGKIFWCVQIELAEDEGDEQVEADITDEKLHNALGDDNVLVHDID